MKIGVELKTTESSSQFLGRIAHIAKSTCSYKSISAVVLSVRRRSVRWVMSVYCGKTAISGRGAVWSDRWGCSRDPCIRWRSTGPDPSRIRGRFWGEGIRQHIVTNRQTLTSAYIFVQHSGDTAFSLLKIFFSWLTSYLTSARGNCMLEILRQS